MNVTYEEATAEEWCAWQVNISESRFGAHKFPNLTSHVRYEKCLVARADGKHMKSVFMNLAKSVLCFIRTKYNVHSNYKIPAFHIRHTPNPTSSEQNFPVPRVSG